MGGEGGLKMADGHTYSADDVLQSPPHIYFHPKKNPKKQNFFADVSEQKKILFFISFFSTFFGDVNMWVTTVISHHPDDGRHKQLTTAAEKGFTPYYILETAKHWEINEKKQIENHYPPP